MVGDDGYCGCFCGDFASNVLPFALLGLCRIQRCVDCVHHDSYHDCCRCLWHSFVAGGYFFFVSVRSPVSVKEIRGNDWAWWSGQICIWPPARPRLPAPLAPRPALRPLPSPISPSTLPSPPLLTPSLDT